MGNRKKLELSDYQVEGVESILDHPEWLLFMGMGLGKTITVLSALSDLEQMGEFKCALVVAPLRVATLTWPVEVQSWDEFSHFDFSVMRGKHKIEDALLIGDKKLYFTNYEQLQALCNVYLALGDKAQVPWDVVVFDETTFAKNPSGKRVNAYRRYLRKYASRHIGLSGSPAPNSELELFSQVRLIDDGKAFGQGKEGTYISHFKKEYFRQADYMGYVWDIEPTKREEFNRRLSTVSITLRTEDHIDLPPLTTHDIPVTLPKEALADYRELEKHSLLELKDAEQEVVARTAAVLTMKLQQFTGGTVKDDEGTAHRINDAKLKALKTLVKKLKEPVIICTRFVEEEKWLLEEFDGFRSYSDEVATKWNAGKIPGIVMNPLGKSHGINLQYGGRLLIWYSLHPSNDVAGQMNKRLHRRGQEKPVDVYRLLVPETVDDVVATALERKENGQNNLLASLTQHRLNLGI